MASRGLFSYFISSPLFYLAIIVQFHHDNIYIFIYNGCMMVFMVVFDFLADRTTKFMSWDNHRLIVPKENV